MIVRDLLGELRYHGETDPWCKAAADEIERLSASRDRLRSAIEFAHTAGFQWPSDPMEEFAGT